MADIYSEYWTGCDESATSGKTWKFRGSCSYSTSQTDTTYTITIGTTYINQSGNTDCYGDGGWHAGATLRTAKLANRVSNKTHNPTINTSYLRNTVNNYSSAKLYFATTARQKVGNGGTLTTITKTHATQTFYLYAFGYRSTTKGIFNGLAETYRATITVPAKTSYAISYNLNGGTSAAIPNQTKWYGETLTLSSTVPTRENYVFKGWATSATATSATYSAGGSYTANAKATLYAVWALGYGVEGTGCQAFRADSTGTATDEGKYGLATARYRLTGANAATGAISKVEIKPTNETTWTEVTSACTISQTTASKEADTTLDVTATITGFDLTACSGITDANVNDTSFDVRVTCQNASGTDVTAVVQSYISTAYFTLDFKAGGRGVGIGTSISDTEMAGHTTKGLLKIGMDTGLVDTALETAVTDLGWTDCII